MKSETEIKEELLKRERILEKVTINDPEWYGPYHLGFRDALKWVLTEKEEFTIKNETSSDKSVEVNNQVYFFPKNCQLRFERPFKKVIIRDVE